MKKAVSAETVKPSVRVELDDDLARRLEDYRRRQQPRILSRAACVRNFMERCLEHAAA